MDSPAWSSDLRIVLLLSFLFTSLSFFFITHIFPLCHHSVYIDLNHYQIPFLPQVANITSIIEVPTFHRFSVASYPIIL